MALGLARWKPTRGDVVWLVIWIAFTIWATRDWADNNIWSLGWWLDEMNHFAAGILGGLNSIYLIRRWRVRGSARVSGWRRFWITILVMFQVGMLGGLSWEAVEIVGWDGLLQPNFFQKLAQAVKNDFDTLFDILLNCIGAFLSVQLYCWYERRFHDDETTLAEIEELMLENLCLLALVRGNLRRINARRREAARSKIRFFRRRIVHELKTLLRDSRPGKGRGDAS